METEPRTIFLATDGRYVTIGRGEGIPLPTDMRAEILRTGCRGWVATLSGSLYARRAPRVELVESINGDDSEWLDAVHALMQYRRT